MDQTGIHPKLIYYTQPCSYIIILSQKNILNLSMYPCTYTPKIQIPTTTQKPTQQINDTIELINAPASLMAIGQATIGDAGLAEQVSNGSHGERRDGEGRAAVAPDVGAGAGASAAEAIPTMDDAMTAAAAAAARSLSRSVAAISFSDRRNKLTK